MFGKRRHKKVKFWRDFCLPILLKIWTVRLTALKGPSVYKKPFRAVILHLLSTQMIETPGDLVRDLPCVQQASYLKGAHCCGYCPCICTLIKNLMMIFFSVQPQRIQLYLPLPSLFFKALLCTLLGFTFSILDQQSADVSEVLTPFHTTQLWLIALRKWCLYRLPAPNIINAVFTIFLSKRGDVRDINPKGGQSCPYILSCTAERP